MDRRLIKIYGLGWVGTAMQKLFPEALVHDPGKDWISKERADIGFVCVPTPNLIKEFEVVVGDKTEVSKEYGALDVSIVEQVVAEAPEDLLVMRSTVNPGTCQMLMAKYGKRIVMQPEYLGETVAHPLFNEHERKFLILGGEPEDRRKVIELYQEVYNANVTIRQVSNYEAELIKLTENRAIAYKVAQCQELYDACQASGVDYYTIRDAVYGDDPRFNLWFSFIYPEKRGFNSKCIPKDIYAWAAWAESVGFEPKLTKALLKYNNELINSNPQ